MLIFELSKRLDKEMACAFLGDITGGIDFGESIWKYHPLLKDHKGSELDYISDYFNTYYKQNLDKLEEARISIQRNWESIENSFLKAVNALFNDFPFPSGKYVVYISSFDCNPRFLEDKTFQVYFKKENTNASIAHELMHFIFYAYCEKFFTDQVLNLDPNSGKWFIASEVFNICNTKYKYIHFNIKV